MNTVKVLIDTGAIGFNFIAKVFVEQHCISTFTLNDNIRTSSIHGDEINTLGVISDLSLHYQVNTIMLRNTEFVVLNHCPFDIIIGLNDIRKHDLTSKLRDYFLAPETSP